MCTVTALDLELDFSDGSFNTIDVTTLNVTISIVTLNDVLNASNIIKTTIPIASFIAPTSRTSPQVYQKRIFLSDITGFCAPGSSWYWTGVANISLGNGSSETIFTISGASDLMPLTFQSAPVNYIAYNNKHFTLLFGDDNLTPTLKTVGYSATCSSYSHSTGDQCYYIMLIGSLMALKIRPNIINPSSTTTTGRRNGQSGLPIINGTVIFDVQRHGTVTSVNSLTKGLTTPEKILIGVGIFIILIIIIALAAWAIRASRKKKAARQITTVTSDLDESP